MFVLFKQKYYIVEKSIIIFKKLVFTILIEAKRSELYIIGDLQKHR